MSEYIFVKPGMGDGGATFSDIVTASALQETIQSPVHIVTGYCSALAQAMLDHNNIRYSIDSRIDRESGLATNQIMDAVLEYTTDESRLVLSQFFAKRETHLSASAVGLAERLPSAVRMHNYIGEGATNAFRQLPPDTIHLPIHNFMATRMLQLVPGSASITIPPVLTREDLI